MLQKFVWFGKQERETKKCKIRKMQEADAGRWEMQISNGWEFITLGKWGTVAMRKSVNGWYNNSKDDSK